MRKTGQGKEEQSEEEYLRHCEKFFKGWTDDEQNKA
ncbi:MAG: hypothetical protein CM15mV103_380 [uncultured marine virus]|nr:MAG: hypothetical protein CM15mV103_380 [uncultured marine virus]